MKKTVAFILSLALASSLSFSAFADAHSGTQTVTTTKSAPTYSIIVPAAISIPWGTTDKFEIGDVILKASSDFDFDSKEIYIQFGDREHNKFISTTPGITTTIKYFIYAGRGANPFPKFVFGKRHLDTEADGSGSTKMPVYMLVEQAAWEAAQAGDYTASVTYTASVGDKL